MIAETLLLAALAANDYKQPEICMLSVAAPPQIGWTVWHGSSSVASKSGGAILHLPCLKYTVYSADGSQKMSVDLRTRASDTVTFR